MRAVALGAACSVVALQATGAVHQGKPAAKPIPAAKSAKARPKAPVLDRDSAVVAATRTVIGQVLKGKVDPVLLTPALRAKLTPAKVRSMGAGLREFGALKKVSLLDRKDRDPKAADHTELCTLKVVLGETSLIATVAVTQDRRMDDLQIIEE
jgi:hypothetical protein